MYKENIMDNREQEKMEKGEKGHDQEQFEHGEENEPQIVGRREEEKEH